MQIAFVSGKGGTGKSCITAGIVSLFESVTLADCDVDTANQHLLFEPTIDDEQVFIGARKAEIDPSACIGCGICESKCRFNAIHFDGTLYEVSHWDCEGCGRCVQLCPHRAVRLVSFSKSRMLSGSFRYGKIAFGRLSPGEENSGKLVYQVRQKAAALAEENNHRFIIIDGPPGTGCPVMSTLTGVDHIVIVTEPSVSGLHDLGRVAQVAASFSAGISVIINKYDINTRMSERIDDYCSEKQFRVLAHLPYDNQVTRAMTNCKTIVEWAPDSEITYRLTQAFYKLIQ